MIIDVQFLIIGLRENIELLNAFIEGMFELFELLCEDSLIVVAKVRFVKIKLIVTRRWGIEMNRCPSNVYNLSECFNDDKHRILRASLFILVKHIFLRESHAMLI